MKFGKLLHLTLVSLTLVVSRGATPEDCHGLDNK